MDNHTKLKLLRSYLKEEIDENLLLFIAENTHLVAFWSQDRFCNRANLSEEQLQGLLRAFGVETHSGLRDLIRSLLYQESQGETMVKRPLSSIMSEVIQMEKANLDDLFQMLDYEQLERLTQDICSASQVIVIGSGGALPYAFYLTRVLTKLNIPARHMSSVHDILVQLNSNDRSSLVLAFGIARYSKQPIFQLKQMRQRGFRIVSFTDRHDSPYVDLSDYYFFLPVLSFDFVDSYTAGMTLINALLLNIGRKDQQKLIANLNNYTTIAEDFGVFF